MVIFKELDISGQKYLLIVDHEDDVDDSGTKLPVHNAMHGNFVGNWPPQKYPHLDNWTFEVLQDDDTKVYSLKSLIHTKNARTTSFQTLARSIISGEAHWGGTLRLNGEFNFIEKYWEWLEDVLGRSKQTLRDVCVYEALFASLFTYDRNPNIVRAFCEAWCPETNTLHTAAGELSLSLWDLHRIGGLPIIGGPYEEVIPCLAELTGFDEKKVKYIPQSCEYLFAAFHHLQKGDRNRSGVRASQWIDFWFSGESRYSKPKPRRLKKASRPQSTQNPDGEINPAGKLSNPENGAFHILGIKIRLREETYLAALISTWLCVFALPSDDLYVIRPTTFKAACMIASKRKTCLAMPVLLSIYRGLNKIAKSPTPGHSNASFPLHYVYGWLARYFSTHYSTPNPLPGPMMTAYSGEGGARYYDENEARNLVHMGNKAKWSVTSLVKNQNELFVDNDKLPNIELGYFFSARSNYLVLHVEGEFLVEPYSPYRFARQFNFYQDIPKELRADVRSTNYELCRILWRTFTHHKSNARLLFSANPLDANKFVSSNFQNWWSKTHGRYMLEGQSALVASLQSIAEHKKSKGKDLVDLTEPSKRTSVQELKTKTAKCTIEGERNSKGSKDKTALPRDAVDKETTEKNASRRLSSIVVKTNGHNIAGCHEKKRDNSLLEDDEQSHNSDQHWKRKKNKVTTSTLDNNDLDPKRFFEAIPDISIPDISLPQILDDLPLVFIDDQEASQGSVDGPDAFELLAKQVSKSPQFKDTGDSIKKQASEKIQTLDSDPCEEELDAQLTTRRKKLKIFDPPTWPRQQQTSEFCPETVILDCRQSYIQMLWNNLKGQISGRPLERMSMLEAKANSIMAEMGSGNVINLSPLQGLLKTFFENVAQYDSTKSMLSEKVSVESYDKLLAAAARRLNDAEVLAKQQAEKVLSSMNRLADIDREEKELKTRLELLDAQRKETFLLVKKDEEELSERQSNVENLKAEVAKIETSTPLLAEESETLEKMKELLEANRKELIEFKL